MRIEEDSREHDVIVRTCSRQLPRGVMMAGGFYNHYDEPDEYWDDEPLRPASKPSPAVSTPESPVGLPPSFDQPVVPRSSFPVPAKGPSAGPTASANQSNSPIGMTGIDFHNLIDDLNRMQEELGAQAAEYDWIDRVSRMMERAGRDPSGAVQTTIDKHNFPKQFAISNDWQERLADRRLDAALIEAVGLAFADGWRRATEEVGRARERGERPPPLSTDLNASALPTNRPLDEIIEDILAISADPTAAIRRSEAEGKASRDVHVRFKFSEYGLSGCDIDQDWAQRHAVSRVATEVNNQLIVQRDEFFADDGAKPKAGKLLTAAEQLIGLLNNGDLMRGR